MTWSAGLRRRLKLNISLSKYTTFKVGGRARFFFEPKNTRELISILKESHKLRLACYVIGNGSNLLVSDKGLDAAVIRLSNPYFQRIDFKKNRAEAGSGLTVRHLLEKAKNQGLGGLEFLAGIPGTVGGALVMNAGIKTDSIGSLIKEVKVIDSNNEIRILKGSRLRFAYRKSNLAKYIILSAKFKLIKKSRQQIDQSIRDFLKKRWEAQDVSAFSAGCVFKNPISDSAGRLIDLCGLKGKRIGDAQISGRHANFIINRGRAKAEDILKLIGFVKDRVKEKFGINLEEEIKIWQ